ncbi:MAG TPA: hypothetical protein VKT77_19860 [Chthonomonadaceae bacterium]|nr:hypothetical protein [Chthonomonadaceae bacterium]
MVRLPYSQSRAPMKLGPPSDPSGRTGPATMRRSAALLPFRGARMLPAAAACAVMAVLALAAAGCGGGGSGGSGATRKTLRERAITSVRLTRGVFAIAGIGRSITRSVRSDRPRLRSIMAMLHKTRDAQPDFDSDLGLFFQSQTDLDGSGHEDLFSDASHNVPAGSFVWQAPVWANGQIDSYPATIHTDYQIGGGSFNGEHGTIDFTADDPSGENGTMHVVMITKENERAEADFTVVNGIVHGKDHCTLPDGTAWEETDEPQDDGTVDSTIIFDDGTQETVDTQPDGSIVDTIMGPNGSVDSTGTVTPDGQDSITYPDGGQEQVDVNTADAGDGGGSGNDGSGDSGDKGARRSARPAQRPITGAPRRR